jgi:hypothetical protein
LQKAATLPLAREPVQLRHPAAVFGFAPIPSDDVVGFPEWRDLGLVQAGDPEDLALDIVLDS